MRMLSQGGRRRIMEPGIPLAEEYSFCSPCLAMAYGFLIIKDARTVRQTSAQDKLDMWAQLLDFPLPASLSVGIPQITKCIRRGDGFALDASFPGFKASLSFDSVPSVSGTYTITEPLARRNEEGIVKSVTPMDEKNRHMKVYSAIARAERGFAIFTNPISGWRNALLWLIGISRWDETPEAS